MTKEEMNGRTSVIERTALLQEVKSDRGKEEKMKLKNQSVGGRAQSWPILDSRLSTSKHPLTTSRRGVRARIRAHAHTHDACVHAGAETAAHPAVFHLRRPQFRGSKQQCWLDRKRRSRCCGRTYDGQRYRMRIVRSLKVSFVLHAYVLREECAIAKYRNIGREFRVRGHNGTRGPARFSKEGRPFGSNKWKSIRRGSRARCALSCFPVRCLHPV